ncbi:MAG: sulfite exporter TauE/SafE family protein [Planctomycetaceae bacterium]|nr:sulfite exporter TauE/SafE family protein [Planctomycetaceae bacterium]
MRTPRGDRRSRVIWAWLGATAVGLSLGLLGSGGAILTVPILVYLVHHDEKQAIAESFAIVGAIALVGAARAVAARKIDLRSALLLAIPGILGTTIGVHTARWIPGAVQLLVLAGLMLTAAFLMFRKPRTASVPDTGDGHAATTGARATALLAAQGVGLGFMTGFVGVGGGFLIVPVLVLLRRLPMQIAVGTSLAIIAVNSSTGFARSLFSGDAAIDWSVVGLFALLGVAGSLAGGALAGRLPQQVLRRTFAAFLVAMACFIVWRQVPRIVGERAPPIPDKTSANSHDDFLTVR